jgi:hypothetical protein
VVVEVPLADEEKPTPSATRAMFTWLLNHQATVLFS